MPHHDLRTRQTKANNGILVNGAGQDDRSAGAQGKIEQFPHQKMLTYARGDAAQAYGGKLRRFLRHVLFLRPGRFAVLDELEAPQPAGFQRLLHALDKMQADRQAGTVTSARKGASLTAKLASDAGLTFSQTDAFDTPYNQGDPPEYHEQLPNHKLSNLAPMDFGRFAPNQSTSFDVSPDVNAAPGLPASLIGRNMPFARGRQSSMAPESTLRTLKRIRSTPISPAGYR